MLRRFNSFLFSSVLAEMPVEVFRVLVGSVGLEAKTTRRTADASVQPMDRSRITPGTQLHNPVYCIRDRQVCGVTLFHFTSPTLLVGRSEVVVVVVVYLYSASRSASNALIVPQRCEEMSL